MVRIIKAVGDLPSVGYVLAWDSAYVSEALKAADVPHSEIYLDKIVQVRLPLPAIGLEAHSVLMNEGLARLHPGADGSYFANGQERLQRLYFSGLREILEQPRDYVRVFNTVGLIEPMLRGEVVLADIIGFAALMVKAPRVYQLIRREPRWFVGPLPGDLSLFKKPEEVLEAGATQRDAVFEECSHPAAVRKLVRHLFPLTVRADEISIGRVLEMEGHIAVPERLLVALQFHVSGGDVSLVMARRYLLQSGNRSEIAGSLTQENCLEFLERLGDIAEATGTAAIPDVDQLCTEIARLADVEPFSSRSRERSGFFQLRAEDIALRAIEKIVAVAATGRGESIAENIVADPKALTVGMVLFSISYLGKKVEIDGLRCRRSAKVDLEKQLAKSMVEAARAGELLATCNPGYILMRLSVAVPNVCRSAFDEMKAADSTLDGFALAMFKAGLDSNKGQYYSLPDDRSLVEAYCSLEELREHARCRMLDPALELPARAAWQAVVEEKGIYGIDGSYVRD